MAEMYGPRFGAPNIGHKNYGKVRITQQATIYELEQHASITLLKGTVRSELTFPKFASHFQEN